MYQEFFFIAALVLYFFFAVVKLEWALTVFPLIIPFYLFKVSFWGIPFTFPEAAVYILLLAYILRFVNDNLLPHSWLSTMFSNLRAEMLRRPSFFKRYKSLLIPVAVFLAAGFLSLLFTPEKIVMFDGQVFESMRVALGILKGWIVAPVILLFLYLAVMQRNNRLLDTLNFYGLSALALCVWALFQVSTDGYTTPDARASGPFESANYLALYIVPALVYVIIRIKELIIPLREEEKRPFWVRIFTRRNVKENHPEVSLFIIGFLLLFLALLATKAYAAMIAALVACLIYFGLEYAEYRSRHREAKNPWKFLVGFIVFIVIMIGIVYLVDPVKWQSMFQFDERNSSSVRVEVYQVTGGLLSENWLTGIGLGQYEALYKENAVRYLGHEPYEWNMLHPHNLYLAMWLNMGLLGLAAFIWILIVAFRRGGYHFVKFASEEINSAPKLRVMGLAILSSILIYGLFDTPFFKSDLAMIFWLIIAVIIAANHEKPTET